MCRSLRKSILILVQTEQFVHALKDELVKSALLEIHNYCIANCNSSHIHSNGLLCESLPANQEEEPSLGHQDAVRRDVEYDEEDWASRSVFVRPQLALDCFIPL